MLTLSCDTKKCDESVVIPLEFVYDQGIHVNFSTAEGWRVLPDGQTKCPTHGVDKKKKKKKNG